MKVGYIELAKQAQVMCWDKTGLAFSGSMNQNNEHQT